MNLLFEKFIGKSLQHALASCRNVSVRLQDRRHHALSGADDRARLFNLRPDAVLETPPDGPIILDTKWKRLTSGKETLGVAESDIYQVLAYGRAYGAARLVLLYPWHREMGVAEGVIRRWMVADAGGRAGGECYVHISTIDVGRPDPVRVAETLRAIVGSPGSAQDLSQAA